jgi:DNA-directed RNA polymerase specialized sigma24 family protein
MDRPDRPTGPEVDPARIQPDEEDVQPDEDYAGQAGDLISEWLCDPELLKERERLQRLEADEELLLELQLNGFAGRPWMKFSQEMARYGLDILASWIGRGIIYGKVKALTGFTLGRLLGWPDPETSTDLAADTVVDALDYFRERVLRTQRWQADQGASLGTFFIGQCMYRFPNRYRSALRAERTRRQEAVQPMDELPEDAFDPIKGIEHVVVAREELADALAQVSTERARKAVLLDAIGYTHKEIAAQLGLHDARQIENMLGYQRRQRRTL